MYDLGFSGITIILKIEKFGGPGRRRFLERGYYQEKISDWPSEVILFKKGLK